MKQVFKTNLKKKIEIRVFEKKSFLNFLKFENIFFKYCTKLQKFKQFLKKFENFKIFEHFKTFLKNCLKSFVFKFKKN